MTVQKKSLLVLLAVLMVAGAQVAPAAEWTDLFVGWRYCYHVYDPNIDQPIIKNVVQFTTANRYSLGSNFLNVDILMSNSNDPANGAGSNGAQEIYITYRHQLSLNKSFNAGIKNSFIRDLSITAGGDFNSKNTAFAPGKKMIVIGPTLNFNLKKGFVDFGVWYYKEWTHNSFASGEEKNVNFNGTAMFNLTWGIPIQLGTVGSSFKGFAYATLPKGPDAVGVDTVTEVLSRITWQFDVGALMGVKKGTIQMGPGYELWWHKFGNDTPTPAAPGSSVMKPNHTTSAPTFQAEIHF